MRRGESPLQYYLSIRNDGDAPAEEVAVALENASPDTPIVQPTRWNVGVLLPGEERDDLAFTVAERTRRGGHISVGVVWRDEEGNERSGAASYRFDGNTWHREWVQHSR